MSDDTTISTAVQAVRMGFNPIPIRTGVKRPLNSAWTHERHVGDDEETVREVFTAYAANGAENLGLLLGEPSGGLIDVDIDHPKASRLKDHFLPRTSMRSGRPSRPSSHYWYRATGTVPGTRRYQMPDGSVCVELRSTDSQTLIPPSMHPSGESYRWEGPGGAWVEPTEVQGQKLAVQVALLGLGCVLLENWPKRGGRHDAYLALAGGLLRYGDDVHPWWERNLSPLIHALVTVTDDEEGPEVREREAVRTTIEKLRNGGRATGFPKLGEIIGVDHAEKARRMAREVESLSGFQRTSESESVVEVGRDEEEDGDDDRAAALLGLPPEQRDPLGERRGSWEPVDLNPYLFGEITVPLPSILRREDGVGLMYPGRINCLYGRSESAKSWVALMACVQEMNLGERVVYIDFEDEPSGTLTRLKALGVGNDDTRYQFTYIHPEEPMAPMQVDRWGNKNPSERGTLNNRLFQSALDTIDPSLIVVDGMTVLYGLHGHDTNDAGGTDIITNWLKSLVRGGRTSVVIIDHTGKGAPRGSTPLGSQHKVAMVQGTAIQVHPIERPRPGKVGLLELLIGKDRPGEVRRHATDTDIQVAAEVVMDSTVDGIVQTQIRVPESGTTTIDMGDDDGDDHIAAVETVTLQQSLRDHIPEVFALIDGSMENGLSGPDIRSALEGKYGLRSGYESWRRAMVHLVDAGTLVKKGVRSDAQYFLGKP